MRIEDQAALQKRNRIAREIHDSLGHTLTAQSIQLENALLFCPASAEKTKGFSHEGKQLGAKALKEVRQSISTLRADPLQGRSLQAAIAALIQDFYRLTNIQPNSTIYLTYPVSMEVSIDKIRLLLVDDQIIIRQGLKSLLESKPDLQVVGDAENGQQVLELIESLQGTPLQPDVVLIDVRMPVMDGVATTEQITQRFPHVKALILTTFDDDEYVVQAMRFGAKAYLLKDTPSEELAIAIRAIYRGYTHLGPGLFEKTLQAQEPQSVLPTIPPELARLSPREPEVLRALATGLSNKEIAQALFISERTVKNHVTSILSQLHLRSSHSGCVIC